MDVETEDHIHHLLGGGPPKQHQAAREHKGNQGRDVRPQGPLLIKEGLADRWGCGEYHVCDGSSECTLIETHEGVVCALTGNYMGPHFQPALRPWTEIRQDTQDQRDKWEPEQVQGLVKTVVNRPS